VTIADLMRHESGLWTLNERVNTGLAFDTKRILGIVQDEPCHNYGESRYHVRSARVRAPSLSRRATSTPHGRTRPHCGRRVRPHLVTRSLARPTFVSLGSCSRVSVPVSSSVRAEI